MIRIPFLGFKKMSKIGNALKKAFKVIIWVIIGFVVLLVLVIFLIRIPSIQNKIVHYATSVVSKKTHTKVEINYIRISFPKSVVINGLFLEDLQKDTLLYAGKIKVNVAFKDLLKSRVHVKNFILEDITLKASRTRSDSLFSYNFLIAAFIDTTKQQPEVKPKTSSKWTFEVNKVRLKNIRLLFDDEYGGIRIAGALESLKLKIDEIDLDKSIYSIDKLSVGNLQADVQTKNSVVEDNNEPQGLLPKISARKIRISNSKVTYGDAVSKQSVLAIINKLNITGASVDLEEQMVLSEKVFLAKSDIRYSTINQTLPDETVPTDQIDPMAKNNWVVSAQHIELDDNSLAYNILNKPLVKNAFDVNHMNYAHLMLKARRLYYSPLRTEVSVKEFSTIDQNGFVIEKFETNFFMDQHSITAKKTGVKTSHSSISADLNIQFASLKSITDSLPFLLVNLDMKKVSVRNSDIIYFSPELHQQPFFNKPATITTFSGFISGRVNDLKGKNLIVKTGNRTVAKTDFSIVGLPEVKTAYFHFPNLSVLTGKQDIMMFAGSSVPTNIDLPGNIDLQIVFNGKIKAFESTVALKSSFGKAQLFAIIDSGENFKGKVNVTGFDLGKLLKDDKMFGPVTLTAEADGHGFEKDNVTAKINIVASRIYMNQYTYQDLRVKGDIHGQKFEGKINLNDENIVFDFNGLVNMNPEQEQYKFQFDLKGADLKRLHLTGEDIRIGLVAAADLKGGSISKINGTASISSLVVAKEAEIYELDSLLFASINAPGKKHLNISSSLIDIKYAGTISPFDIANEMKGFINRYFLISDSGQKEEGRGPSDFAFEIRIHNHPILTKILLPQLTEFEPGIITGSFNSEAGNLKLDAGMKKIVYGGIEILDLSIAVGSDSTALKYKIICSNVSNEQIKLENFLVDGNIADNTLFTNISSIGDLHNKKVVLHSIITKENDRYKFVIDPKDIFLVGDQWSIADDHYIMFGKEGILIHHWFMNKAEEYVHVASVNDRFNDDISIEIMNFKLDDLSRIIENDTSLVKGVVEGNILLKKTDKTYGIIADAKITDLVFRDIPIGDVSLKADNPSAGKFAILAGLSGADNNLIANGYYMPNAENGAIDIKVSIQSLSMKTIQAFSLGQITEASGIVTGDILVQGSTKMPEITGSMIFNNVFIRPAALNNTLELKHETVVLKPDGLFFKSFTLLDSDKHPATIDGMIKMKQFKDFMPDLRVSTENFLLFNTTAHDNQNFYGRMIIDSRINVQGPMKLLVVNGRLKLKEGSNFTFVVPESKLTADKGEGVVEFIYSSRLNPILYRDIKKESENAGLTGFDLSTIIEIDKQATLKLLLDPTSSDSLVVKGEAALSFSIDRSGKMSLTGAYNLETGSYLITLQSVLKRKFDIIPGSTMTWSGDLLDAEISINAKYLVRAAPYDLIATQMSGMTETEQGSYKQRFPFWVILKLRGEILHPVISFEIQLPPEEKGIIGGAVNQKLILLNEDESALNKQVIALLVMGRFIQENPLQSESNGISPMLRSTVGNYISEQLNKLSSKALPGTELVFDVQSYDDYQTGKAQGRTQVEIGIKKQLFNERLTVQVGGAVDVEGEKAKENSANEITSDVTVEYKLTKDGLIRLRGFRHNQYEGAIEGQLVETGIGIGYVRDFNKWKEFFKRPKRNIEAVKKEEIDETIDNQ